MNFNFGRENSSGFRSFSEDAYSVAEMGFRPSKRRIKACSKRVEINNESGLILRIDAVRHHGKGAQNE